MGPKLTPPSDLDMSATPTAALHALSDESHQNLPKLHALMALMAQKLPEEPSRVHSIVIVGLRGVGKSTLALMALAALGFQYLDVEKCVSEVTGMPEALYLQKVTVEQYQQLQYELITSKVKSNNGKSQIIVMPLTTVSSLSLLEYLRNDQFNYIINIECEEERVLKYLSLSETPENFLLVRSRFKTFQSIATHDFFNCFSESSQSSRTLISVGDSNIETDTSFFVLKPVERDFIRFVTFLIRGPDAGSASVGNLHLRSNFFKHFTNCLPITFPQTVDIKELSFVGIDCIELKVDIVRLIREQLVSSEFRLDEIVSTMRRLTNSSVPFIMSIDSSLKDLARLAEEESPSSEAMRENLKTFYITMLGSAIRLGSEYLSVDLALGSNDPYNFFIDKNTTRSSILKLLAELVANRGSTEIIGTYHSDKVDFWENDAYSVLELAHSLSIETVRLSSHAEYVSDNFRIVNFRRKIMYIEKFKDMNVCAYNTGALGKLSKVFNQHLTPVGTKDDDFVFSPFSLQRALFSSCVLPKLQFHIMGLNVSKSASPLIHEAAYKAMGLEYKFTLFECGSLMPELSSLVKLPNFGGTAIIMPFKLEALKYVDTMSNHVKVIGALNTIVANRDMNQPNKVISIRGENTDWLGVRITLQDSTSPINAVSMNKCALVIGAGGMARSAIYALIQLGYQHILLYNRTQSRAEALAGYYNALSPMLPSKALTTGEPCDSKRDLKYFQVIVLLHEQFTLGSLPPSVPSPPTSIVSCVPSSDPVTGELTRISIERKWFASPSGGVVLETGYDPLMSSIMKRALEFKHRGWTAVNGLNWLLAQAIAQFEMFTGKQAPVALMKSIVDGLYAQRMSTA